MRADRLISILLTLQAEGRVTSGGMAGRLGVSTRTIHRDMEALSHSGIPVFAERGYGGGWQLDSGYRTNLTGMKVRELEALLLAPSGKLLKDLGRAGDFETAFLKLQASVPRAFRAEAKKVSERILVDGAPWHESSETHSHLPIIHEAVWASMSLVIDYPREGRLVERTIDPIGLIAKGSIWYLIARTKDGMRSFRISRIGNARVTGRPFVRPEFDLADFWEKSKANLKANLPQYPAVIDISQESLDRLHKMRYVNIRSVKTVKDSLQAKVMFETLDSACSILLSLADVVRVIQPVPLRKKLHGVAKKQMEANG
ncbi:MAG: YafY family transcriptional regulator [Spirochaetia bacterium]|nr:YafY family transcriptional regulator [Spirochaetia bacterium]